MSTRCQRRASFWLPNCQTLPTSSGFLTRGLPSAPRHLIITHDDPFRPQPRLDRDNEAGMATTVGRLRKDDALDNGWKYLLVSHNTKMGAAKGAVLVAEALAADGLVG